MLVVLVLVLHHSIKSLTSSRDRKSLGYMAHSLVPIALPMSDDNDGKVLIFYGSTTLGVDAIFQILQIYGALGVMG